MDNKKNITIKEIAKFCGVGIGTVSRAINNQPGVKEEVRRKILGHINDIGWRRSNIIERISSIHNGKLVIFVASRMGTFARHSDNDILDLLFEQCELQNYETMLLLNNRKEALRQCAMIKPYAVIQVGHINVLEEQEQELVKLGIRLINLAENENYNGVMLHPDHYNSARDMLRALRRAGHRKIGFLGGLGSIKQVNYDKLPTLRLQNMIRGISDAHPEFDIENDCLSDNYGNNIMLIKSLKEKKYTAWVCDEQRSCALFLNTTLTLNIKIPDDVSLVTISPEKPPYIYPIDVSRSYCNITDRCKKVMELLGAKTFPEHEEYIFPNGLHRGQTIKKIKEQK